MITTPKHPRGKKKAIQSTVVNAPIAGIDSRHPLAKMPSDTCVYAFNMVPDSYGMSLRKGYKEFATKVPIIPTTGDTEADGIKTIVVFRGTVENTIADDRIFAVSNMGIYDITNPTVAPVEKLTFDVQIESAGNGVSCHYIDEGGHEFVLYADERNGLFVYTQSTDTWEKASGISGGIAVEEIVYVIVHKLRVWFVQRDTADAWYMPVNAMVGTATKFTFGSKFANGGYLRGLYNWTFDGGEGVDDYLVAISSSGDVLPYKGSDPSTSDSWSLVGSYYVGELPVGRRIATQAGGQLFILSSYGLISMNDLLTGVDTRDISADGLASRIAPIIRPHLKETRYERGWELIFAPSEGVYIINTPPRKHYPQIQYVMSLATTGWGVWRGIPTLCIGEWGGKLYFGHKENVYIFEGYRDNVKKLQVVPDDVGLPIKFSIMTSYSNLGSPATYKMAQFVRPDFLSKYHPSFGTKILYDYDINEVSIRQSPESSEDRTSLWDIARWDQGIWGDSRTSDFHKLLGSSGIGRTLAIALAGEAVSETKLISFDVMWTVGGLT